MPKNVRSRNLFITDQPGQAMPDVIASVVLGDTDRGFLPNRLTTDERDAMEAGALIAGVVIYNTTIDAWQTYNGDAWVGLGDWTATLSRIDVSSEEKTQIDGSATYQIVMHTDGEETDADVELADGTIPGQRCTLEVSLEEAADSVTLFGGNLYYNDGAVTDVVFGTDGGFILVEWDRENDRWNILQNADVTINAGD